ncbi:MAG: hypothetical protein HKN60_08875, partial [Rhizobiales bacterium]|nr:hypothetical protein [Hyphomicrobiales bacterium]
IDEALTRSINTISAQVANEVGIWSVIDVARRLGIEEDLPEQPSLALGTGEVTLYQLTGAFANLASGGKRVKPHVISRVLSADGRVLYENVDNSQTRVLTPIQVGDMNLMLGHVVSGGTGRRAQLDAHKAAGKTGTTQDYRDAWFIGYTGHYTAGVWVGNDDNSEMNRVTGGSLPAMIWKQVMEEVHQGLDPIDLPESQSMVSQPYGSPSSGGGSFFGNLFGFGQRQQPQTDPRARGAGRYGYRYYQPGTGAPLPPGQAGFPPGQAGFPPGQAAFPPGQGVQPFGQQLQRQARPNRATRRGRERAEKSKTRLILGGRPVENERQR